MRQKQQRLWLKGERKEESRLSGDKGARVRVEKRMDKVYVTCLGCSEGGRAAMIIWLRVDILESNDVDLLVIHLISPNYGVAWFELASLHSYV